jgi:phage tail sheath gpL-like
MANPITILGWTVDDKVPGFYGETKYGAGRVSVGEFPVTCLITGTKASDGTMVADQDIEPIISLDDAVTKLGQRPMATQQARAALSIEGVNLWAAPPAEATGGGATAAFITISIGGSWTLGGTIKWTLDGNLITTDVAATGETAANVETNVAASFNGWVDGPVTGVATTDCVLTCASVGTGGNQYKLGWDLSEAPPGLTVTVTGGTAIHPRLVPFSGGVGTESVANIIALMRADTWDYIAPAQVDSTNLGLFEAHMASEAGPTIGHLEHMITARTSTLVDAQSLSQTTLNDARSSVMWLENCETHPAEIAAGVAALRSVIEPQDPNYNYDDTPLPFVAPQVYKADMPGHATLKAALNSGISPLKTENGVVKIVRGIVSRCLNGTTPDYNTLDWGDAIVPDRIRKEIAASWVVFKAANPKVGRDAVAGEPSVPDGVGTPLRWAAEIDSVLRTAEQELWIQDVDDNPPQVVLDTARRALVAAVPVVVRWNQHSAGVSVRQQAA